MAELSESFSLNSSQNSKLKFQNNNLIIAKLGFRILRFRFLVYL